MTTELNAIIIGAVMDAIPSSITQVRYAGVTVEHAICGGIEKVMEETDYGQLREAEGVKVWMQSSDEPVEWNGADIMGKVVEVKVNGGDWAEYRVVGRLKNQGGVGLTIASKDGRR